MTITTVPTGAPSADTPPASPHRVGGGLLDPKQMLRSLPDALRKLNPATLWRNPVMFIVEIGSAFTGWLWLTVLFANLAEAVAEGRGKAQAESLRRAKKDTMGRRLSGWRPGTTTAAELAVPATELTLDDIV